MIDLRYTYGVGSLPKQIFLTRMRGRARRAHPLPRLAQSLKREMMKRVFDMDDRARLRERFFGASHTVIARL